MKASHRLGLGMMLTAIFIALVSATSTLQHSPLGFEINGAIGLIIALIFTIGFGAWVSD